HLPDFSGRKNGRRKRIEHESMDGRFDAAVDTGLGGEVEKCLVRGADMGHLRRKRAETGGVDAVAVDHAGDLDGGVAEKVSDELSAFAGAAHAGALGVVHDVAVNSE